MCYNFWGRRLHMPGGFRFPCLVFSESTHRPSFYYTSNVDLIPPPMSASVPLSCIPPCGAYLVPCDGLLEVCPFPEYDRLSGACCHWFNHNLLSSPPGFMGMPTHVLPFFSLYASPQAHAHFASPVQCCPSSISHWPA